MLDLKNQNKNNFFWCPRVQKILRIVILLKLSLNPLKITKNFRFMPIIRFNSFRVWGENFFIRVLINKIHWARRFYWRLGKHRGFSHRLYINLSLALSLHNNCFRLENICLLSLNILLINTLLFFLWKGTTAWWNFDQLSNSFTLCSSIVTDCTPSFIVFFLFTLYTSSFWPLWNSSFS